jgi:hypothetical protein
MRVGVPPQLLFHRALTGMAMDAAMAREHALDVAV